MSGLLMNRGLRFDFRRSTPVASAFLTAILPNEYGIHPGTLAPEDLSRNADTAPVLD